MSGYRRMMAAILRVAAPGRLATYAFLACSLLAACVPADRVAGSSTEAGNATGKLSLKDGSPAQGVSVALVAPDFLPETTGVDPGDRPGLYYRARTGADGRFLVPGVLPGRYRVLAIGPGIGTMVESLTVVGRDTTHIERTLAPLGAVNGITRYYGEGKPPIMWVRPRATLKQPPRADGRGLFRLDSLPEGEYELIPECMECAPADRGYRVRVSSGSVLEMDDTLRLYPQMFAGFPDSGDFELLAGSMPYTLGGKLTRGGRFDVKATHAEWTWNGSPLAGADQRDPEGLLGTGVTLDSNLLGASGSGRLRVVLHFPDTVLSRAWNVTLARPAPAWPLMAVEADRAEPINGPKPARWRFHVVTARPVDSAEAAFWNLEEKVAGFPSGGLPEWISLDVDSSDGIILGAGGDRLTFLLVPGGPSGATVFRPRRDERLEDLGHIRLFDRSRMGFDDSLIPFLVPEGLRLERARKRLRQAYGVDLSGQVQELLGQLSLPGRGEHLDRTPLLFWRTGPADSGFDWRSPMRDAHRALAVTREGRAYRLDAEAPPVDLPPAALAELETLLAPMDGAPPALRDTAVPAAPGTMAYLRYGNRGILRSMEPGDSLLAGLKAWMVRAGLESPPGFPLRGATWLFQEFILDPDFRATGDTLILRLEEGPEGTLALESLSPGSPGRASDTLTVVYTLFQEGDSLKARSGATPASSRLFGNIDGTRTLFPVLGLSLISPRIENGLPVLDAGSRILAGRLEGNPVGWGRDLVAPGLLLDGSGIESRRPGWGFLHTPDSGLERVWRFGGSGGSTTGWNRL